DQLDDAVRSIREAASLRAELGDGVRHGGDLRHLSRYLWCVGDNPGAERAAARAVEVLEKHPPGRELAMALENEARLRMLAGESAEAIRWARRAIALARRIGDAGTEIHALIDVSGARSRDGDLKGFAHLERAKERARALGLEDQVARSFASLCAYA